MNVSTAQSNQEYASSNIHAHESCLTTAFIFISVSSIWLSLLWRLWSLAVRPYQTSLEIQFYVFSQFYFSRLILIIWKNIFTSEYASGYNQLNGSNGKSSLSSSFFLSFILRLLSHLPYSRKAHCHHHFLVSYAWHFAAKFL